jgi:hypothetical protein
MSESWLIEIAQAGVEFTEGDLAEITCQYAGAEALIQKIRPHGFRLPIVSRVLRPAAGH